MAQVDMPKSSIGQTPTEPKKKLEKVVKGKVAVKEQSDMQKIASQFLAEDLKTVKDRILTDYLLPMLKNGAWSINLIEQDKEHPYCLMLPHPVSFND